MLEKYDVDILCPLLPTSPQRLPSDIDRGIGLYLDYRKRGIYMREFVAIAPMHESLLYRIRGDRVKVLYFDKYYNSGRDAAVCSVIDIKMWMQYEKNYITKLRSDKDVDKKIATDKHFIIPWPWIPPALRQWKYFWPVKEWQIPDINYRDEFDFVELIMKHFVLRGRGPEIYYKYKYKVGNDD
jgi:hypothetical protein